MQLTDRICDLIEARGSLREDCPGILRAADLEGKLVRPQCGESGRAEGIAQFMPAQPGCASSQPSSTSSRLFLPGQIPRELEEGLRHLGLAAAAYNAGEGEGVIRWLSSGGFLPLETEEYVLDVMGRAG